MYMSFPQQTPNDNNETMDRTEEDVSESLEQMSLANVLTPLQNELITEDYNKLWQELHHSGRELDVLYNEARNCTYAFKEKYDLINKTKRVNGILRDIYYNALQTKKKREEERDKYFQSDKDLADVKENFIEDSQELALGNSKYVEYNQRFAIQREQYIARVLRDVNESNKKYSKLKTEKNNVTKQLNECRGSLNESKNEVASLKAENEKMDENCKSLEKLREKLLKDNEWMVRSNNKLKDQNESLKQNITSLHTQLQVFAKMNETQVKRERELETENGNLKTRCSQLQQLSESLQEEVQTLLKSIEEKAKAWEEGKKKHDKEITEMKKKMKQAQQNTYNTQIRNQNLREKLKNEKHKNDSIKKEQLKACAIEKRTRDKNTELTKKQLELINELLEMKNDFFIDQARIKKGGKLNQRLQNELEKLQAKVTLLRENPSAIDPLDDAQEFRELTRHKYSQRKLLIPSPTVRQTTTTLTKVT